MVACSDLHDMDCDPFYLRVLLDTIKNVVPDVVCLDGDSIVFFKKSNVVHMGDHLFSGFYPFVDVSHGGNVLNMAKNVKAVLSMVDNKTKIIPGHGPLSNKKDLQDFYDMLIGTSAEVKAMKDKGLNLDEIKAKGLSKKWDSWTKGFLPASVWIGIVHSSL